MASLPSHLLRRKKQALKKNANAEQKAQMKRGRRMIKIKKKGLRSLIKRKKDVPRDRNLKKNRLRQLLSLKQQLLLSHLLKTQSWTQELKVRILVGEKNIR